MSNLHNKIEAIYPLSPMQQGLLFHSLYSPGSGTYVEQVSCRIERGLDVEALKRSWQSIVDRHPILRTSFLWEGLSEPQQVVHKEVEVPWKEEDWRSITAAEQSERLRTFLAKDQEAGFEFSRAPLMRVTLLRTGEDAYYFIWSSHHILLDGWCNQLLFGEVFTRYEAYRCGKEVELARPRPYRDYIAWLKQQDLKLAEDFWRRELRGFTSPTKLPFDRGSELRREERIQEQAIRIDREMTSKLDALARNAQVTMSILVQGVWALTLSRYSGQEDVAFGMTVSGRSAPLPEIESMIGLFINTLPVRAQISGAETVHSLLKRLQAWQAKALEYEYSPLMEVQGWSEAPRGTPLFDSTITFQNYPVDADIPKQTGSTLQISEIGTFTKSHYPLHVLAAPGAELLLRLTYDASRFGAADILRILQHLQLLLATMATNPEERLGELEMLTAAERQQILVEWNTTAGNYDQPYCAPKIFEKRVERGQAQSGDLEIIGRGEVERPLVGWDKTEKRPSDGKLIHELIGVQARVRPESIAVIYQEWQLSYRELESRANQLANHLRSFGVEPDCVVGLYLDRSIEMMIGLLGILKAGGAYLPLQIGQPIDRLGGMLEGAGAKVIVTKRDVVESLPVGQRKVVTLDGDWEQIAGCSREAPEVEVSQESLIYVIYTSGSTGKPKGVMVKHGSALNLLKGLKRATYKGEGEDLTVSMNAPLVFDASVQQVIQLGRGQRLCIAPEDDRVDAESMLEYIKDNGVDVLDCTPSHLRVLVEAGLGKKGGYPRIVLVGGEAIDARMWREISASREVKYYNVYGPTECTVDATVCVVSEGKMPAIGRPIVNTRIHILDNEGRATPIGVVGEIYIGGAGLARGYIGEAGLTAEKFVPDAVGWRAGERLYRTGDLGRYLEDGEIEFLGRHDDQVKVRGYRIELREIEAALKEHGAVRQCAVCVREDEPGDKRLVAYVVSAGQRPLARAELRAYLQEKLPEPMVPWAFVEMSQLPLTSNGKLDWKALPPPIAAGMASGSDGPRTPLEKTIADVWREVLKLEWVGVQQNFFELGGHSLLATQVFARLRDLLGIKLRFRALFDNPTVRGLASAIARECGESERMEPQAMRPVSRNGHLPLSFAQQRLWFMEQLDPESTAYTISIAFRLRGPLNTPALELAFGEIVRRHEVLRTTFQSQDGNPCQVIGAAEPMIPPIINLCEAGEEAEAHARRLVRKEAERPFNLSQGPLLRVMTLKLAGEDHVITITMHHIITDGWSLELLVGEFVALYEAYGNGRASSLPELELQYADFATWQREWLQGEVLDEGLRYWKKELSGELPIIEFPGARPRPKAPSYKGNELTLFIPSEISEGVKEICRAESVTMFMALLAAFDILLHKYTGHEDVMVGTAIAGRTRAETERMMGMFINMLPLRVDLRGRPSYKEVLKRVKESTTRGFAYQDIPIEKIIEELGMERQSGQAPFIQMAFGLETVPEVGLNLPNLELESFSFDREAVRFDLTVWLKETARGLRSSWAYRAELFDAKLIAQMHNHFVTLLKNILAAPDAELADLEILTEAEKKEEVVRGKAREQSRYERLLAAKHKAIKPSYS